MSEQQEKEESADIGQLSADLKRGLSLCHSVVDEFRLKLAANTNEAQPANDDGADDTRLG